MGGSMSRITTVILILCCAATTALAQDWLYDENIDGHYNCELVRYLFAEYGDEDFMKMGDDFVRTLGDVLVMLSSVCLDEADRVLILGKPSETEEEGGELFYRVEETEVDGDIIAVLEDNEIYSIDEADCSVTLQDRFEEDLNVSLAGMQQDSMSVDVYLPGESVAIDMPYEHEYEVEAYGVTVPVRTVWAEQDSFPLGRYRFDLYLQDSIYRFEWLREDQAVNTIVVMCIDFEPGGESDPEPAGEIEGDLSATLEDGQFFELEDTSCFIVTTDMESDFLSVVVSGEESEDTKVELTYPGLSNPIEMEHFETLVSEDGLPYRIEWVTAEAYPTGAYNIKVTAPERSYHFQWNRENDAYRTIVYGCLPPEAEE